MRKLLGGIVLLAIAGAFVAGYWPQHAQLVRARAEAAEAARSLAEADLRLAQAEARARTGRLFGQYLALEDAVAAGNFGAARTLSSSFFDEVRDEGQKTTDATVRTALDAILMRRDTVTAGLAREQGSVREVLVPVARELRRALGYPLPDLVLPAPPPK